MNENLLITEGNQNVPMNTATNRLAQYAAANIEAEKSRAGGKFIGTEGGILSIDGNDLDYIEGYILGDIFVNAFYGTKYDPKNKQSPRCYAFSDDDHNMSPHPECSEAQNETCIVGGVITCPHNQFGSAENQVGKACRNVRRVAIAICDKFTDSNSDLRYFQVSVTSSKIYAQYKLMVASRYHLPLWAVKTRIQLKKDKKNQFTFGFSVVSVAGQDELEALEQAYLDQLQVIDFPYPKPVTLAEVSEDVKSDKRRKF